MNIKVGDYIRYLDGEIEKVKTIGNIDHPTIYTINSRIRNKFMIKTYNSNLEKIVEENDLIKDGGQIVKVNSLMLKMRDEQGILGLPDNYNMFVNKITINKILTHEQFEENAYKVD